MSFIETYPENEIVRPPVDEVIELVINIDIFPAQLHPPVSNYLQQRVRFKVDGVEFPISSFDENAASAKIGTDFSVVLARNSDRSEIEAGQFCTLEIGEYIDNVLEWTVVNSGYVNNNSYQIGLNGRTVSDSVSIGTASPISEMVNISPLLPTTYYDSREMKLSQEDFTPIYDISGGSYNTVIVPIPGLSLYTLLNLIVGGVIGIPFISNVPNYPVKRLDIGFGQSA